MRRPSGALSACSRPRRGRRRGTARGRDPAAGRPLVAVGGAVIDATPTPVKEFAVRTLGTYDKPVLLGGIGLALVVFAAVIGVAGPPGAAACAPSARSPFGAVGVAAAVDPADVASRSTCCRRWPGRSSMPGAALLWSLRLARPSRPPRRRPARVRPSGRSRRCVVDRRAVPAGRRLWSPAAPPSLGAARVRRSAGSAAGARGPVARRRSDLPAARRPGAAAAGRRRARASTPRNADFYRVDTALTVPAIDVDTWRLRIHGMVDRPVELSFDDLLKRAADRAGHHPQLRLQRGRRPVHRHRPLARRPARAAAARSRRPGRAPTRSWRARSTA